MYPDVSLQELMDWFLRDVSVTVKYHLYKNDVTPTEATVLADLTESDFTGYAGIGPIVEPSSIVDGAHQMISEGNTLTWTCTADLVTAQQAFGLYVTWVDDTSTTRLLRADRFTSPITIAFNGDQVQKKVDFYFKNYNP